ncbi:TPA: hypothetical protein DD449_05170 [Candidatus Berkelbacteria bacterium]|uniref:Aminoglycoside phosphotransferase domain-containing protein n=1 Tax=Berkelbacteria bacterium GW2011_GWE1_39_12 TaxID=1618337 RepID=A0A0G4B611_9BACT|nr:MAG: hypothetical protein UT28_C0001G0652 [Berkelbacteria bacterium GW2011_GWE1_39_12]HBO61044.1 hypothetical protein [Candidatus Berkelbacteria bacterium]
MTNDSNDFYLLDKENAEKFFQEFCKEIFGKQIIISVLDLKRSHTYNPDNYNIYYLLKTDGEKKGIRLSTSKVLSKKDDFLVMNFFHKNGFQDGMFIAPKPLAYLEKDNIFIYEDTLGDRLSDSLSKIDNLDSVVEKIALLLKKVHNLSKPEFTAKKSDFIFENFQFQLIENNFPKLEGKLKPLIDQIKEKNLDGHLDFCHGDFNPNNILLQGEKIVLIDFGSSCFLKKELDMASFLVHLEIMLCKTDKAILFDKLEKTFLNNYGEYDNTNLVSLSIAINLRLLEISLVYPWADRNQEFQSYIYNLLEKNISKYNEL